MSQETDLGYATINKSVSWLKGINDNVEPNDIMSFLGEISTGKYRLS